MLRYKTTTRDPKDLKLGGKFKHVHYHWRPYDERPVDHQEDYGRLFNDIQRHGIKNPLIVFRDCVLIGQRRCEIAQIQNIPEVTCWEIQDDISEDAQPDRVYELKAKYETVKY